MKFVSGSRLGFLCALLTLSACSPDALIDPSTEPEVPSADAFHPDFSFFEGRTPAEGGETDNWQLALSRVATAEAAMSGILDIPRAALDAAGNATGTRSGNSWVFPFSTTVDGVALVGQLRSGIAGGQYTWDLYVDAPDLEPPLANYLLSTGLAGVNATGGQWFIADVADASSDLAGIVEWVVNQGDEVDFAFSGEDNVVWTYQRTTTGGVVTRLFAGQPQYRVTWNSGTAAGSTWTADTNITQCWNADLHDVACP